MIKKYIINPAKAKIAKRMPVPQVNFIGIFFESKITTKKGIVTHKSIDFFDSNTLGSEK